MTVSYVKSRPHGGRYYLDGLGHDVLRDPENPQALSAQWWVGGDAVAAKEVLGVDHGYQFTFSDRQKFDRLLQGYCPIEGQVRTPLVHNAGSARRIALHDFTLSAPKSVSVIWALAEDELKRSIAEAQLEAAKAYVTFIAQRAAYSRRGRGGVIQLPCTVGSVIFGHGVSMADDPQLHSHCVLLNVTVRPDGSTGALETLKMMRWQGAAAGIYHSELARGIQNLGFEVAKRKNLFEVQGVPTHVCDEFSQRRSVSLQAAHQQMRSMGHDPHVFPPSRKLIRKAVLHTRPSKKMTPRLQLERDWSQRAHALGFGAPEISSMRHRQSGATVCQSELLNQARAIAAKHTWRQSDFAMPKIFSETAVALMGLVCADEMCSIVDAVLAEFAEYDQTSQTTQNVSTAVDATAYVPIGHRSLLLPSLSWSRDLPLRTVEAYRDVQGQIDGESDYWRER